jgi:hypothetical protein
LVVSTSPSCPSPNGEGSHAQGQLFGETLLKGKSIIARPRDETINDNSSHNRTSLTLKELTEVKKFLRPKSPL